MLTTELTSKPQTDRERLIWLAAWQWAALTTNANYRRMGRLRMPDGRKLAYVEWMEEQGARLIEESRAGSGSGGG